MVSGSEFREREGGREGWLVGIRRGDAPCGKGVPTTRASLLHASLHAGAPPDTPRSEPLRVHAHVSLPSDGTLNPNGVRFGSSEIYNIGRRLPLHGRCQVPGREGVLAGSPEVGFPKASPLPPASPCERTWMSVSFPGRTSGGGSWDHRARPRPVAAVLMVSCVRLATRACSLRLKVQSTERVHEC